MDKKKVTVLVPAYNAQAVLVYACGAVLAQSHKNLELVLVDDGSYDRTAEFASRLATQDSRVILVSKHNAGVASARNTGLAIASGTYLAFSDADDAMLPEALAGMISCAEEHEAEAVIASFIQWDSHKESKTTIAPKLPADRTLNAADINEMIFKRMYRGENTAFPQLWNKLFLLQLIIRHGICFDSRRTHGEDWAFVLDVLCRCSRVAVFAEPVYTYRVDGSQTYAKYKKNMLYCLIDGNRRMRNIILERGIQTSAQENDQFNMRFFSQLLLYLQMQQKERLLPIPLVRYRATRTLLLFILFAEKGKLYQYSYSRKHKIVALLMLLGCNRVAQKIQEGHVHD